MEFVADAHSYHANRLVTVHDGTVLSASDDGTIRHWDLTTARQKLVLKHDHWVRDIAVSSDGHLLASSSLDNTVRLWDLIGGRELFRLPGNGLHGGMRTVEFSRDGRQLPAFGDDYNLRVWDAQTGKELKKHRIRPEGLKARFSPGAWLLALSSGKHFIFDVNSGQATQKLKFSGSQAIDLAVSPDGRYLLVSAWGEKPAPNGAAEAFGLKLAGGGQNLARQRPILRPSGSRPNFFLKS